MRKLENGKAKDPESDFKSIPRVEAQKEKMHGVKSYPHERCEVGPRSWTPWGRNAYRPMRVN